MTVAAVILLGLAVVLMIINIIMIFGHLTPSAKDVKKMEKISQKILHSDERMNNIVTLMASATERAMLITKKLEAMINYMDHTYPKTKAVNMTVMVPLEDSPVMMGGDVSMDGIKVQSEAS